VTLGDWYLEHRERAGWERNTQKNYRSVFGAHVADSRYGIADEPLPTLSDERIARFRDDMDSAGVPANAQSKTLTLVSSLLSAAAERRSYTGVRQNPMLRGGVKTPRAKRVRPVLVFAPVAFEAVRFELLLAPGRSEQERARDALWQSCTSLAGLRPEEAWALQPDFFRERTIAVVQAVAHGEIKRTKEDEWHYPPLHPLLREELDAYLERWPVEFGQLVFDDPGLPGKPIADHNWRDWRKRVWRGARDRALAHVPARERAKLLAARPYDLGRHTPTRRSGCAPGCRTTSPGWWPSSATRPSRSCPRHTHTRSLSTGARSRSTGWLRCARRARYSPAAHQARAPENALFLQKERTGPRDK
jgi:hypothetical protein